MLRNWLAAMSGLQTAIEALQQFTVQYLYIEPIITIPLFVLPPGKCHSILFNSFFVHTIENEDFNNN